MAVTKAIVLETLADLQDPVDGGNLVDTQRISGVTIKDKMVQLSLDIGDPAHANSYEEVKNSIESTLQSLEGVLNATVILTAERGSSQTPAPTKQAEAAAGSAQAGLDGIKKIIAVASGKGGVGKSTTAINLACALSKLGHTVGLLDADIYGPSLPRMLGRREQPHTGDGKTMLPIEAYGLKTMSIGFVVPEDEPVIWRGPMVMGALGQMLKDVQWGELDILIVDMPPGTGDAQLSLSQQARLAGAVIVSTPQDIALIDARKGLNMFRKTEVPVLGIIENMSVFHCPECGHASHIFGQGGAKIEAERLSVPFLGEVPLDISIRTTSDQGYPIVLTDPEGPHASCYKAIATKITDSLFSEDQSSVQRPRIRVS